MKTLKIKTPAKLNLYLNILGFRSDNYHNIETIFQTINLYDELEIFFTEAEKNKIKIFANVDNIPTDKNNLVFEAIEKYLKKTNLTAEIIVKINKKIPVAAGLAGGSTNAAGTLKALNFLNDNLLNETELKKLARDLGADVSFFFKGGTALGTGIGDILKPINTPKLHFILVKPTDISIGSGWAYKEYDQEKSKTNTNKASAILDCIKSENTEEIGKHFHNSLEEGVFKHFPILQDLKDTLINMGCHNALMSGSGPTVFGLLKSEKIGKEILNQLAQSSFQGFLVETIPAEN